MNEPIPIEDEIVPTGPGAPSVLGIATSPELEKIAAALAKAQGEFSLVEKTGENKHFNCTYLKLEDLTAEVLPKLAKQGIATFGSTAWDDASRSVVWQQVLLHTSGQWIRVGVPTGLDANETKEQAIGSAITYARRYSLGGITGVAADEDDDGEASRKSSGGKKQRKRSSPKSKSGERGRAEPVTPKLDVEPIGCTVNVDERDWQEVVDAWHGDGTINEAQRKKIFAAASNNGWEGQQVLDAIKHHLGVSSKSIPWGKPLDLVVALFESNKPSESA